MILRRLYFLIPDYPNAEQAVADLLQIGVDSRHIHTIAKLGVDVSGLPKATAKQRSDLAAKLDQWFWDLNLLLFFIFMALFLFAMWNASWGWALVSLLVMGLSFWAGHYFVRHLPHAHLDEYQVALRHGEILLLVDVPRWRISAVEKALRRRHPEAELGGVSWTLDALGI